jgi:hypothetical protein
MRVHFPLDSPSDTLWAVVAGAILATVGGFVATQVEAMMRRRERERSAALMFGEILSALGTLTLVAQGARARGEPYGSFTLRLIRAAQREIETYERNRATLYDLRDAEIRIRIHALMVQVSLALEGVSEASMQIAAAQAILDQSGPDDAKLPAVRARLDELSRTREEAFEYVMTVAGEVNALVAALQPLAKVDFSELKKFSGNPYAD